MSGFYRWLESVCDRNERTPDDPAVCDRNERIPDDLTHYMEATSRLRREVTRLRRIVLDVAGSHPASCECEACDYYHEWRDS